MELVLYKFFEKEEYRNAFLAGKLYANKLSYYRYEENQTIGVSDGFENAELIAWADENHFVQNEFIEKGGEIYVKSTAYDSKPQDYRENQGFISYATKDYNVFCMSSIPVGKCGEVCSFDKSNLDSFGQYGIVVLDTNEFINRIKSSVDRNANVSAVCGNLVEYVDFHKRDSIQRWTPFHKFSFFAYQQEYRVVFDASEKGAISYTIPPLKDIVQVIDDKLAFFNGIDVGNPICLRGE